MEIEPSPTIQPHAPSKLRPTGEQPVQPPSYYARGLQRIDRVASEHRSTVEDLIEQKRADRLFDCGTKLWFLQDHATGKLRLQYGWFCGFPFCPICSHRRRWEVQRRVQIATKGILQARPACRFIEILFTVKNCPLEDLRRWALALTVGFCRMTKLPDWPGLGSARGLEAKRAEDGQAHPHLHGIIVVAPSYVNGQNYLSRQKWKAMWMETMGLKDGAYTGVKILTEGEEGAEEAAEIMGYSQEDEPEDEDEFLWNIRAWKEMYRLKRLQCYGVLRRAMPSAKATADPLVEEQIGARNRLAKKIKFTWGRGVFDVGSW